MTRLHRKLFAILFVLCSLATALPAAASAELQTLDFESGPALNTPFEGAGSIHFPQDPGFRPYRTGVGARAHSGTTVGDLGRCTQETSEAGACEFFQAGTTGFLDRTAQSVTVFAGTFADDPSADPELAALTAFRANGTQIASSGFLSIDDDDFDTQLSVTSAGGEIASFKISVIKRGPGGDSTAAGDLGIDDVRVNFATGAKPDLSLSTGNQVTAIVQGTQVDVPINLARVNGSNGPVGLSISGLPKGVTGTFIPNPVPGTQTKTVLRLSAALDAPDTAFVPTDATVKADPLGNAEVGTGPRTATVSVRVAANFGLSINGDSDTNLPEKTRVSIKVPDCAAVEVPLRISRDIAFNQPITLSLRSADPSMTGLPPGVSAEILPTAVVSPGGGLIAERTLRFRADASANITRGPHPLELVATTGSGPKASSRILPLELERAVPTAAIGTNAAGSTLGDTPRFGGGGTVRRIHGSGFCPGTSVRVGNAKAEAQTRFVNDHEVEFNVPRYATSFRVTIIPPSPLGQYSTEDFFRVDSVRNIDGFQFDNPEFGALSLGEFVKGFGADDVFERINPCWPLGSCPVQTFFVDPLAALKWGYLNATTVGHCFGMDLASEAFTSGKESRRNFRSSSEKGTASSVFDLRDRDGPSGDVEALIDAYHVRQFSDEYYRAAFVAGNQSIAFQLGKIEEEFAHNREPLIALSEGHHGHAVLAYDIVETADGTDIYAYDPNRPFQPIEANEGSGVTHAEAVDASVVHIDTSKSHWSYRYRENELWSGDKSTITVAPVGTVPENPRLPGLGTLREKLKSVVFGSPSGAARAQSDSSGAKFVPAIEASPRGPGASFGGGTWLAETGGELAVSFIGVEQGSYNQVYSASGFAAALTDVATAKGVRDTVEGAGDSLSFGSGVARPLRIQVAQRTGAEVSTAATLDTHASADGTDSAGFSDTGALIYEHEGAATAVHFSLTVTRRNGGPSTFDSGPVRVRDGDRLSVRPIDRDLLRVRLGIRNHGRTTTRVVRSRGGSHLQLRLGRPRVAGHRLSTRASLSGARGRAVAGVVLRLVRGHRVLAHKAVSVETAKRSKRIAWRLPDGIAKGRYRLVMVGRAVVIGGPGSTGSASDVARRSTAVSLNK